MAVVKDCFEPQHLEVLVVIIHKHNQILGYVAMLDCEDGVDERDTSYPSIIL